VGNHEINLLITRDNKAIEFGNALQYFAPIAVVELENLTVCVKARFRSGVGRRREVACYKITPSGRDTEKKNKTT
jgi:hypothetical protein